MNTTGKIALFVGGTLFGSVGFKLLGSKDARNFHLMSWARAEELGFVPGPDAK